MTILMYPLTSSFARSHLFIIIPFDIIYFTKKIYYVFRFSPTNKLFQGSIDRVFFRTESAYFKSLIKEIIIYCQVCSHTVASRDNLHNDLCKVNTSF